MSINSARVHHSVRCCRTMGSWWLASQTLVTVRHLQLFKVLRKDTCNYFASVFTVENMNNLPDPVVVHAGDTLRSIDCHEPEILEKLKHLKPDKAPGFYSLKWEHYPFLPSNGSTTPFFPQMGALPLYSLKWEHYPFFPSNGNSTPFFPQMGAPPLSSLKWEQYPFLPSNGSTTPFFPQMGAPPISSLKWEHYPFLFSNGSTTLFFPQMGAVLLSSLKWEHYPFLSSNGSTTLFFP